MFSVSPFSSSNALFVLHILKLISIKFSWLNKVYSTNDFLKYVYLLFDSHSNIISTFWSTSNSDIPWNLWNFSHTRLHLQDQGGIYFLFIFIFMKYYTFIKFWGWFVLPCCCNIFSENNNISYLFINSYVKKIHSDTPEIP